MFGEEPPKMQRSQIAQFYRFLTLLLAFPQGHCRKQMSKHFLRVMYFISYTDIYVDLSNFYLFSETNQSST